MKNNNKKIKNVFLGHTLEEYKAIYDIDKTIHIDKHAVDEFNKKHRKDTKDSRFFNFCNLTNFRVLGDIVS